MTTMVTPLGRILIPILTPLLMFAGCLGMSGCNMLREFGEPAAQYPGVHVEMPSLFAQGSISYTSDGNAEMESAEYHGASPDGKVGASLVIKGAKFSQNVTTPMGQVPAILEKLPPMLETRVQIVHEITTAVPQSIEALADAVSPIAAGAHMVRDVFRAANQQPTPEIAALLARIDALEQATQDARATTQPATP